MFNQFVAGLVTTHLGKYFENVNREQVKVSLWSGHVRLRDLRVRKDALRAIDTAICIKEGSIDELTVVIPWTRLQSECVVVLVKNVRVVLQQKTAAGYDPERERREAYDRKLHQLDIFEALLQSEVNGTVRSIEEHSTVVDLPDGTESNMEAQKDATFSARLKASILNNLRLELQNVVVQYEGSSSGSIPNKFHTVSLVLDLFKTYACDERYEPHFTAARERVLYKKAILEGMRLCLGAAQCQRCVLSPTSVVAQVRYQPVPYRADLPAIGVHLHLDTLRFSVNRAEWAVLRSAMTELRDGAAYDELRRFRPFASAAVRPTKDPRGWWCYAIHATLHRVRRRRQRTVFVWDVYRQLKATREEYGALFRRARREVLGTMWLEPLDANEAQRLRELEMDLPLESVKLARRLVYVRARLEREQRDALIARRRAEAQQQQQQYQHRSHFDREVQRDTKESSNEISELDQADAVTGGGWWSWAMFAHPRRSTEVLPSIEDDLFDGPEMQAEVEEMLRLVGAARWTEEQRVAIAKECGIAADEVADLADAGPIAVGPRWCIAVAVSRAQFALCKDEDEELVEGRKEIECTEAQHRMDFATLIMKDVSGQATCAASRRLDVVFQVVELALREKASSVVSIIQITREHWSNGAEAALTLTLALRRNIASVRGGNKGSVLSIGVGAVDDIGDLTEAPHEIRLCIAPMDCDVQVPFLHACRSFFRRQIQMIPSRTTPKAPKVNTSVAVSSLTPSETPAARRSALMMAIEREFLCEWGIILRGLRIHLADASRLMIPLVDVQNDTARRLKRRRRLRTAMETGSPFGDVVDDYSNFTRVEVASGATVEWRNMTTRKWETLAEAPQLTLTVRTVVRSRFARHLRHRVDCEASLDGITRLRLTRCGAAAIYEGFSRLADLTEKEQDVQHGQNSNGADIMATSPILHTCRVQLRTFDTFFAIEDEPTPRDSQEIFYASHSQPPIDTDSWRRVQLRHGILTLSHPSRPTRPSHHAELCCHHMQVTTTKGDCDVTLLLANGGVRHDQRVGLTNARRVLADACGLPPTLQSIALLQSSVDKWCSGRSNSEANPVRAALAVVVASAQTKPCRRFVMRCETVEEAREFAAALNACAYKENPEEKDTITRHETQLEEMSSTTNREDPYESNTKGVRTKKGEEREGEGEKDDNEKEQRKAEKENEMISFSLDVQLSQCVVCVVNEFGLEAHNLTLSTASISIVVGPLCRTIQVSTTQFITESLTELGSTRHTLVNMCPIPTSKQSPIMTAIVRLYPITDRDTTRGKAAQQKQHNQDDSKLDPSFIASFLTSMTRTCVSIDVSGAVLHVALTSELLAFIETLWDVAGAAAGFSWIPSKFPCLPWRHMESISSISTEKEWRADPLGGRRQRHCVSVKAEALSLSLFYPTDDFERRETALLDSVGCGEAPFAKIDGVAAGLQWDCTDGSNETRCVLQQPKLQLWHPLEKRYRLVLWNTSQGSPQSPRSVNSDERRSKEEEDWVNRSHLVLQFTIMKEPPMLSLADFVANGGPFGYRYTHFLALKGAFLSANYWHPRLWDLMEGFTRGIVSRAAALVWRRPYVLGGPLLHWPQPNAPPPPFLWCLLHKHVHFTHLTFSLPLDADTRVPVLLWASTKLLSLHDELAWVNDDDEEDVKTGDNSDESVDVNHDGNKRHGEEDENLSKESRKGEKCEVHLIGSCVRQTSYLKMSGFEVKGVKTKRRISTFTETEQEQHWRLAQEEKQEEYQFQSQDMRVMLESTSLTFKMAWELFRPGGWIGPRPRRFTIALPDAAVLQCSTQQFAHLIEWIYANYLREPWRGQFLPRPPPADPCLRAAVAKGESTIWKIELQHLCLRLRDPAMMHYCADHLVDSKDTATQITYTLLERDTMDIALVVDQLYLKLLWDPKGDFITSYELGEAALWYIPPRDAHRPRMRRHPSEISHDSLRFLHIQCNTATTCSTPSFVSGLKSKSESKKNALHAKYCVLTQEDGSKALQSSVEIALVDITPVPLFLFTLRDTFFSLRVRNAFAKLARWELRVAGRVPSPPNPKLQDYTVNHRFKLHMLNLNLPQITRRRAVPLFMASIKDTEFTSSCKKFGEEREWSLEVDSIVRNGIALRDESSESGWVLQPVLVPQFWRQRGELAPEGNERKLFQAKQSTVDGIVGYVASVWILLPRSREIYTLRTSLMHGGYRHLSSLNTFMEERVAWQRRNGIEYITQSEQHALTRRVCFTIRTPCIVMAEHSSAAEEEGPTIGRGVVYNLGNTIIRYETTTPEGYTELHVTLTGASVESLQDRSHHIVRPMGADVIGRQLPDGTWDVHVRVDAISIHVERSLYELMLRGITWQLMENEADAYSVDSNCSYDGGEGYPFTPPLTEDTESDIINEGNLYKKKKRRKSFASYISNHENNNNNNNLLVQEHHFQRQKKQKGKEEKEAEDKKNKPKQESGVRLRAEWASFTLRVSHEEIEFVVAIGEMSALYDTAVVLRSMNVSTNSSAELSEAVLKQIHASAAYVTVGVDNRLHFLDLRPVAQESDVENETSRRIHIAFDAKEKEENIYVRLGRAVVFLEKETLLLAISVLYEPYRRIVLPEYSTHDVKCVDSDLTLRERLILSKRTKMHISASGMYNHITIDGNGHEIHFMDCGSPLLLLDEGLSVRIINARIHLHGKALEYYMIAGNGSYVILDPALNFVIHDGQHDKKKDINDSTSTCSDSESTTNGSPKNDTQNKDEACTVYSTSEKISFSTGVVPYDEKNAINAKGSQKANVDMDKMDEKGRRKIKNEEEEGEREKREEKMNNNDDGDDKKRKKKNEDNNSNNNYNEEEIGFTPRVTNIELTRCVIGEVFLLLTIPETYGRDSWVRPSKMSWGSKSSRQTTRSLVLQAAMAMRKETTLQDGVMEEMSTFDLNEFKVRCEYLDASGATVDDRSLLSEWALVVRTHTRGQERRIEVASPHGIEVRLRQGDVSFCWYAVIQARQALGHLEENVLDDLHSVGSSAVDTRVDYVTLPRIIQSQEQNRHQASQEEQKGTSSTSAVAQSTLISTLKNANTRETTTTKLSFSLRYLSLDLVDDSTNVDIPLLRVRIENITTPTAIQDGLALKMHLSCTWSIIFYNFTSSSWSPLLEPVFLDLVLRREPNVSLEDRKQRKGSLRAGIHARSMRIHFSTMVADTLRRVLLLKERFEQAIANDSGTGTASTKLNFYTYKITQHVGKNMHIQFNQGKSDSLPFPCLLEKHETLQFNFPRIEGHELPISQHSLTVAFCHEPTVVNIAKVGRSLVRMGPGMMGSHVLVDVSLSGGQKVVIFRTNIALKNELPFAVEVGGVGVIQSGEEFTVPIDRLRQRASFKPLTSVPCSACSPGMSYDLLPHLYEQTYIGICKLQRGSGGKNQDGGRGKEGHEEEEEEEKEKKKEATPAVVSVKTQTIFHKHSMRVSLQQAVFFFLRFAPKRCVGNTNLPDCKGTFEAPFFIVNGTGLPLHIGLIYYREKEKQRGFLNFGEAGYFEHVTILRIDPEERCSVVQVNPLRDVYLDVYLQQANGETIGRTGAKGNQSPVLVHSANKRGRAKIILLRDQRGATFILNFAYKPREVTIWCPYWFVNQTSHYVQLADVRKGPLVAGLCNEDGIVPGGSSCGTPYLVNSERMENMSSKASIFIRIGQHSSNGLLSWTRWSDQVLVGALNECGIVNCALSKRECVSLSYTVEYVGGCMKETRLITLRPRWILVNRTESSLAFRHANLLVEDEKNPIRPTTLAPDDSHIIDTYRVGNDAENAIQVQYPEREAQLQCCEWSKPLLIDKLGDRAFNLRYEVIVPGSSSSRRRKVYPDETIVRVGNAELFARAASDVLTVSCYRRSSIMYVVISRPPRPPYVIENRTKYIVFVRQRDILQHTIVYPCTTRNFTWEDPASPPVMELWASDSPGQARSRTPVLINFDPQAVVKRGEQLQQDIRLSTGGLLFVRVRGLGSTSYAISVTTENAIDEFCSLPYSQYLFQLEIDSVYALLSDASEEFILLTIKPVKLVLSQGADTDGSGGDEQKFEFSLRVIQIDDERRSAKQPVVAQLVNSRPVMIQFSRKLLRTTPVVFFKDVLVDLTSLEVHLEDSFLFQMLSYWERMRTALGGGSISSRRARFDECPWTAELASGRHNKGKVREIDVWKSRVVFIDRLLIEQVTVSISLYRSPGAQNDPMWERIGYLTFLIRSVKDARFVWRRIEQRGVYETLWLLGTSYSSYYRHQMQQQMPNVVHVAGLDMMRGFVTDLLQGYFSSSTSASIDRRQPRVSRRVEACFDDNEMESMNLKEISSDNLYNAHSLDMEEEHELITVGMNSSLSAANSNMGNNSSSTRWFSTGRSALNIVDIARRFPWKTFCERVSDVELRECGIFAVERFMRTIDLTNSEKLKEQLDAVAPSNNEKMCERCAEIEKMRSRRFESDSLSALPHPTSGVITWTEFLHHVSWSEFVQMCSSSEVRKYAGVLLRCLAGEPSNMLRIEGSSIWVLETDEN